MVRRPVGANRAWLSGRYQPSPPAREVVDHLAPGDIPYRGQSMGLWGPELEENAFLESRGDAWCASGERQHVVGFDLAAGVNGFYAGHCQLAPTGITSKAMVSLWSSAAPENGTVPCHM